MTLAKQNINGETSTLKSQIEKTETAIGFNFREFLNLKILN